MPLRFPRPVLALIAIGTAAIAIGLSAVPASADQTRHSEWWLSSLGVTSAWAASQGAGVTVAVLSDGVAARHADLAGAVTAGPAPAGAPVAAGQYFGERGTPIASLIAGRGHGSGDGSGILGVAPEARILSVPVTLPPDDPQLSESLVAAGIPAAIAAGIRYAVGRGASVIDLPIDPGEPGSTGTGGAAAATGGSAAEHSAVKYALAHNVVLVAPAGDDEMAGDAPNYPAAYRGVIAVGAFDSAFNKAAFSSHQSYVTITAAGAGVLAAASTGGYERMNSTSAASAVVAGVVALIRSRYPGLSPTSVRTALITSTRYRRAGGLAVGSGYGAVNADKAMAVAATLAARPAGRASAGAQPIQAPAPVSAAREPGVAGKIGRAGELSGGLLLLLVLLIAVYAATGRRRRRPHAAVAADWSQRPGQSRYPQANAAEADRMLEIFAASRPAPDRYAGQAAGAPAYRGEPDAVDPAAMIDHGGWPGQGDEGLFAPAGGRRPAGAPPAPALAPGSPGDAAGWLSHGPASRAVSRRANVSGAPPWEPASAPPGELPWTETPGRHVGTAPPLAASAGAETWTTEPTTSEPPRTAELPRSPEAPRAGGPHWTTEPPRATEPHWTSEQAWHSGFTAPDPSAAPASPAGWVAAAPSGRSEWDAGGPAGQLASELPEPPRVAPSSLPVRQPRAARPAAPAAPSPSGSLWDPVEPDAVAGEPGYDGEAQEPGSRPIFVWNPSTAPESYPAAPRD